ncbi:hypothetical protein JHK86_018153 [Glycine max]|nr:hypothetical protein JHK86_018153 [Glycine max]
MAQCDLARIERGSRMRRRRGSQCSGVAVGCKFHVTDASLTQFNLRSNNTLDYNLKVSITVRNPNNNIIVYYGRITSIAWYKDNDFSWVSLTPFGQCRKNTTFLQAVFEGKSVIKHKSKELGEYKDETSVGI